jgi:hypothetical protein
MTLEGIQAMDSGETCCLRAQLPLQAVIETQLFDVVATNSVGSAIAHVSNIHPF